MDAFDSEEERDDANQSASRKHLNAMAAIEARIKEQELAEHRKVVLEKARKTIQKLLDQGMPSHPILVFDFYQCARSLRCISTT